MAFSGTYDIATITNPSSALTDFTLIVDLSNASAGFKSAWDTALNGKGRAVKGDGVTELACDWIDLNHTAKTGILRVKWSGTLASSGTQQLRIYPPKAANATYGASDTYGQYNAYNVDDYLPLGDSLQGRTYATSYSVTGTPDTGQSGNLGDSSYFGTGENIELSSSFDYSGDWSGYGLVSLNTDSVDCGYFGTTTNSNTIWLDNFSDPDMRLTLYPGIYYDTTANAVSTWKHLAVEYDSATTTISFYVDGVLSSQHVTARSGTTDYTLGGPLYTTKNPNQYMQHFIKDSHTKSVAFYSHESSQLLDNATFWGTWTNVPVAAASNPWNYYAQQ